MSRSRAAQRKLANGVFVALCGLATTIALAFLVAILWTLVSKGLGGISVALFTIDQPAPGSTGGLRNAIVGSLIMCGMGMAAALVVGILAGTWLAEICGGVESGGDRALSERCFALGAFDPHRPAGLRVAGGAVPWLFRLCRGRGARLRRHADRGADDRGYPAAPAGCVAGAGMALGAGRALVIRRIVWRAARTGLLTGGLLGFARISGETAPLLFTSLGNQFYNADPSQPMASLPTTIFQFALSAYDEWQNLAWAGALLIAVAVLAVNIVGRLLARESHLS